ncbi:peptidoglycan DD-metalloendopeptidase family protein [Candidatus Uhrbacteria bacterium]|nr:peptidoglycan DD-metalloendopeptidase family protein [Candidatus Uhrbacteria bacterium]
MKKVFFDFAFGLVHSIGIAFRRMGRVLRWCVTPLRGLVHAIFPVFLLMYGLFVKIRILYAVQKKDAGHLLMTPVGEYLTRGIAFFLIGTTVILAPLFRETEDNDVFHPSAILARFVLPEEEVSVSLSQDAQNDFAQSKEYAPESDTIKSTTPIGKESTDENPALFPGELAGGADSLLKPIIPTGETLGGEKTLRIQTYIVKSGDTISTIAAQFGLNVSTLLWANSLSERTLIHEGQKLTIPPVNGVVYIVRKGDTLGRIAQLFNTEVEKIIQINGLARADSISIGQTLILPDAHPYAPAQPRTPSTLLARLRNFILPSPKRIGESAISSAVRFIWPTSARRITQYFNWRHSGVDVAGPISNKIYAAAGGRVTLSGWQRGYGLTLLVDHGNGYVTRYAHARKLLVSSGDYVDKGETIAMMGSTGRSTGPHLHFEVLRNGRRVNPLSFIR